MCAGAHSSVRFGINHPGKKLGDKAIWVESEVLLHTCISGLCMVHSEFIVNSISRIVKKLYKMCLRDQWGQLSILYSQTANCSSTVSRILLPQP